MISVYILTGPNKDQVFQIEKDAILVGRSGKNDINLIDRNVSRKHLKIFREHEQYFIMDLGSKNGTYIKNEQVVPNSKVMITEPIPILIGMSVLCLGKACKEHIKPYLYMVDISKSDEEGLRHSVINYEQNIDLMNKLSDILSNTSTVSEMMERILEIVFQVSRKINRVALIILEPKTGNIAESLSKVSPSSNDTSFTYDLDVVNHVLKTKKPFQFLDAYDEHDDGISETLKVSRIRSVICFPLSGRSRTIGVMYVDSIEKAHSFQKEDVYMMKLLSEKIGLRLGELLLSINKKPVVKERRKHKRFKTYDDLYVFFGFDEAGIGQIVDMSEGGIGFLYTGHKNWSDGLSTVDITTADYLFSIKDLPVKAIWESQPINEDSFLSVETKRCGIQFRHLSADQKSRLMDFIEIQTSKAEYLKK